MSILPGEFLWTCNGVHDIGNDDIAKVAEKHTIIDIDQSKAKFVYDNILEKRLRFHNLYFQGEDMVWVREPSPGYNGRTWRYTILNTTEWYTLPCMAYNMDCNSKHLLSINVDWANMPTKPKFVPKRTQKTIYKPVLKTIPERVMNIGYDSEKGKRVAKFELTGRFIQVQEEEELEVYDENGRFLEVNVFPVTEKETVEVDEVDEDGNVVLVIEKDVNGKPVMLSMYDVKYIDAGGSEIDLNTYNYQIGQGLSCYRLYKLPCIRLSERVLSWLK